MEQIKDELGSNATLLHTKKYREGGALGGAEMIEVTAAVDDTQMNPPRATSAYVPPASPILPTNVVNQYRMSEQSLPEGPAAMTAGRLRRSIQHPLLMLRLNRTARQSAFACLRMSLRR